MVHARQVSSVKKLDASRLRISGYFLVHSVCGLVCCNEGPVHRACDLFYVINVFIYNNNGQVSEGGYLVRDASGPSILELFVVSFHPCVVIAFVKLHSDFARSSYVSDRLSSADWSSTDHKSLTLDR